MRDSSDSPSNAPLRRNRDFLTLLVSQSVSVVGDAASGDVFRRAVMGPFGKTQETFYRDGKVALQNIFRYDANGRVVDWLSLDGEGAQTDRLVTMWGKSDLTERKTWGKEQQMRSNITVDPATNEERFTTFDESGVVAVNWNEGGVARPSMAV